MTDELRELQAILDMMWEAARSDNKAKAHRDADDLLRSALAVVITVDGGSRGSLLSQILGGYAAVGYVPHYNNQDERGDIPHE